MGVEGRAEKTGELGRDGSERPSRMGERGRELDELTLEPGVLRDVRMAFHSRASVLQVATVLTIIGPACVQLVGEPTAGRGDTGTDADGTGDASGADLEADSTNAGDGVSPVLTVDAQTLTTVMDAALAIQLTGTGPRAVLAFHIESPPTHGTLSGTGPVFRYVPSRNFVGDDSFTAYATSDGARSASARIDIAIVSRRLRAVAPAGCDDTGPGTTAVPWCTIKKAGELAEAGDLVLITPADYGPDELIVAHTGTPGRPITFRRNGDGEVVLGGQGDNGPIAQIDLRDIAHIELDGLTVRNVRGWVFARGVTSLSIENCRFADGMNDGKGAVKLIETQDVRFVANDLENGFDNLLLIKSDRVLVEANRFRVGRHTVLSIRCSNYTVVRGNHLTNTYLANPEKLSEVFDCKAGGSPPGDIGVFLDATKHNLFEANYYGYTPPITTRNGRTSAIQYSGQAGIIRRNVFSHGKPPIPTPAPGGVGLNLRLGGSAEEGSEAQYVYGNRVFANTFYEYNAGAVTIPGPDPLFPAAVFADNVLENNALTHGLYDNTSDSTQAWMVFWDGKPVQLPMLMTDGVRFEANDFFSPAGDAVIALRDQIADNVEGWQIRAPTVFTHNCQVDPGYVDAGADDFELSGDSPLIDAGIFLVRALSQGPGDLVEVDDTGFFFDSFGHAGEDGDMIRFASGDRARIVAIDRAAGLLYLDRIAAWSALEGVALDHDGGAPDIGACESGRACVYPR
jgi:hypothetical protein